LCPLSLAIHVLGAASSHERYANPWFAQRLLEQAQQFEQQIRCEQ